MKLRISLITIILLFIPIGPVFADRQLSKAEILQLFKTLTDQPRETWISTGTIEAKHIEYKSLKGLLIESTVIVKYDGDRFYWEINKKPETKQTESQGSINYKSSREDFDMNGNAKRIFIWDGEQYTMYFKSGGNAIIIENPSDIPVVVNGPLTAGIVPWGYGIYTYEDLSAAESTVVEQEINGQIKVYLTIKMEDMPEMDFVLDPTKDYAVSYHSLNYDGHSSIIKNYEDYELVSGRWIPKTIYIEKYNDNKKPSKLLSYDYWEIKSVEVSEPQPSSFITQYETGDLVEYYSSVTRKPLSYYHSNESDISSLFQDKLVIDLTRDFQSQNCATIAMKYVASQLGKEATDEKLAELVSEQDKSTSLYAMRRFAQDLDLYCLATKTDIQTLKDRKDNCQVILHLPGPNHYVVLQAVDDEYVWIIDLDSNKFYYRIKVDEFSLDWSEGTALLISNEPGNVDGAFNKFSDQELHKIIGSDGFESYSCTERIRLFDVVSCSNPKYTGGICMSRYDIYFERYACEYNEEGGSCIGEGLIERTSSPCINRPEDPLVCTITGKWTSRYIRACN